MLHYNLASRIPFLVEIYFQGGFAVNPSSHYGFIESQTTEGRQAREEAHRARPGVGQRQDGRPRPQGRQVEVGLQVQARLRRRPDAAAPARTQARVSQSDPRRVRRRQHRHARRAVRGRHGRDAGFAPRTPAAAGRRAPRQGAGARRRQQGADDPRAQVQRQGGGEGQGGGWDNGADRVGGLIVKSMDRIWP